MSLYAHVLIVSNNLYTQADKIIKGGVICSRVVITINSYWWGMAPFVVGSARPHCLWVVETLSTHSIYYLNFHILVHTINFIIILSGAILQIPLTGMCLLINRIYSMLQIRVYTVCYNKGIFVYMYRIIEREVCEAVKQERSFTPVMHISLFQSSVDRLNVH